MLGATMGLSALMVHNRWWGLPFGLAVSALLCYALPPRWWGRIAYAIGWAAVIAFFAVPRPEGDFVIANDVFGYAVLIFALAQGLAAMLTVSTGHGNAGSAGESS